METKVIGLILAGTLGVAWFMAQTHGTKRKAIKKVIKKIKEKKK